MKRRRMIKLTLVGLALLILILLHINFLVGERGCMAFGGEWLLYTVVCTTFAWRVLGDVDY